MRGPDSTGVACETSSKVNKKIGSDRDDLYHTKPGEVLKERVYKSMLKIVTVTTVIIGAKAANANGYYTKNSNNYSPIGINFGLA